MRESPSIPLVLSLLDKGAKVRAYDPQGMEEAKRALPDIAYAPSAYACVEGADATVIVTEWEEFRALDLKRLRGAMARPVMVDLRNIYRPDEMERHGIRYDSIGRQATKPQSKA
jgi:UDPglucose 6-dehydrogenase